MAEKKEKQYVCDNARLMSEWDWEENNKINLYPDKVTHGSTKIAHWLCVEGHHFSARIDHRTIMGSNCPYCAGKLPILGINDLATTHPEILLEWDYEHNPKTPELYLAGSNKRVGWICKECGHHWTTQIIARTAKNTGCPICSRIQRGITKSSNTIVKNGSLEMRFPELASEWDFENNAPLTPADVHSNSRKKVWWIGKCGHAWQATIQNRVAGNGCSVCAGKTVLAGFNDLASQFPNVAIDWAYDLNGDLSPNQISAHNDQKVWWRCPQCDEVYFTSVYSRTSLHTGCPVCTNRMVVQGKNDVATTHPHIAKEWNYTKNNELLPTDLVAGSNKRIWWICEKGHEWQATVNDRKSGRGCPYCNNEHSSSYPEQILFYYLSQITTAINRHKICGKEIDIYLPTLNIGIEYNGRYYHKNRAHQDNDKYQFLRSQGVRIVVVHESNQMLVDDDTIYYQYKNSDYLNFDFVVQSVCDLCRLPICDVNIPRDRSRIFEQYLLLEKANSLAEKHPWLVDEWDYERNGKLTPWQISYGSNKRIHWICKKCGHRWEAIAYSRKNNGCPCCARKKRANPLAEK